MQHIWKSIDLRTENIAILYVNGQLHDVVPNWRRQWHPTPVLLSGKSMDGGAWWAAVHGVAKSRDTTERLHFDFSLSCIGEGNGNPLRCSCLENPRDGGAWWAALYGVAQSRTRLKRLSSSSSSAKLFSKLVVSHYTLTSNV